MASVMRFDEWQDSNGVPVLDGAGGGLALGKILQVVSTNKTDTFSVASPTLTDVTGLSATITPSATSSKILVMLEAKISSFSYAYFFVNMLRDATSINIGDAAGSRRRLLYSAFDGGSGDGSYYYGAAPVNMTYLDEPSTTSPVTYQLQVASSGTAVVNQTGNNADTGNEGRYASNITLMEVAG